MTDQNKSSPRARLARACVATLGAALGWTAASAEVLIRAGGEFQVNTFTPSYQRLAAVAADGDGDFVVAWQSLYQDGSSWGVFGRRFAANGAALTPEFEVNEFTNGYQDRKSVSFDGDGDFVIVWGSSGQDSSGAAVFARRFDSAGAKLGIELQVNVLTAGIQHVPVVAAEANGDFVVAWRSLGQDGDGYGIFARQFDSAGAAKASELAVNAFTVGVQDYQTIASDADGDFVIVWSSAGQDSSGKGVFARRFSSAGAALATEFQVSSYTPGDQYQGAVGAEADGDFVIAWNSVDQDGASTGVFARRWSSAGVALGVEFQVNTNTLLLQDDPAIALDSDGDFVVAWSASQDGSAQGIFARSFDSAGIPRTNEFQINSYVTGDQDLPAVAFQGDGAAVIVWESALQDGAAKSIQAQRLALAVALDIDGNGATDPLTDGLLFLRFHFGFTGATLTTGAVADNCTRCDATTIGPHIASLGLILDIDGDGALAPLTDGLLVLRFLFGFSGPTLTTGVVDADCSRCDAAAITPFLQILDG